MPLDQIFRIIITKKIFSFWDLSLIRKCIDDHYIIHYIIGNQTRNILKNHYLVKAMDFVSNMK